MQHTRFENLAQLRGAFPSADKVTCRPLRGLRMLLRKHLCGDWVMLIALNPPITSARVSRLLECKRCPLAFIVETPVELVNALSVKAIPDEAVHPTGEPY
jgi:hypothetical protein